MGLKWEGSLKDLEDWGKEKTDMVVETGKDVVNNTVEDIRKIFGGASECLAEIDSIRVHVMHRIGEYATRILQELLRPLFDIVQRGLAGVVQRDPRPSLWWLTNPYESIWAGDPPNIRQITSPSSIPQGHTLLLIHGMNFKADPRIAYDEFVKPFEKQFQYFVQGSRTNVNLLFLSWDTWLLDEDKNKILAAIGFADAGIGMILWGVLWRELERRAEEVTRYLEPYIKILWRYDRNYSNFVISHSLGSYLWSYQISTTVWNNEEGFSGKWWSFQPAVLFNAYDDGEVFHKVPEWYKFTSDTGHNLYLWHSTTDIVLSTAYLFAKQGLAMGQVGANYAEGHTFWQRDVSAWAGPAHGETEIIPRSGGYFRRIGTLIRQHKPVWP